MKILNFKFSFGIVLLFFLKVFGQTETVFYESKNRSWKLFLTPFFNLVRFIKEIRDCSTGKEVFLNVSNLYIHAENDTHSFLNGSLTFMKEVISPWKLHVFFQKKMRGEWVLDAVDRTYSDFCDKIGDSEDKLYFLTKDLPKCPYVVGVSKIFFFNNSLIEIF